jgi:hypothetical protein
MIDSNRLHRGADRRQYQNYAIPDVMNYPSYDFASQVNRNNYAMPQEEQEPETVYVSMHIDSEEDDDDLETKYVKLVINT